MTKNWGQFLLLRPLGNFLHLTALLAGSAAKSLFRMVLSSGVTVVKKRELLARGYYCGTQISKGLTLTISFSDGWRLQNRLWNLKLNFRTVVIWLLLAIQLLELNCLGMICGYKNGVKSMDNYSYVLWRYPEYGFEKHHRAWWYYLWNK